MGWLGKRVRIRTQKLGANKREKKKKNLLLLPSSSWNNGLSPSLPTHPSSPSSSPPRWCLVPLAWERKRRDSEKESWERKGRKRKKKTSISCSIEQVDHGHKIVGRGRLLERSWSPWLQKKKRKEERRVRLPHSSVIISTTRKQIHQQRQTNVNS